MNDAPGIFSLVIGGGSTVGETLVQDKQVPLISFTGSTRLGRHVNEVVSSRFGKTILELGGKSPCIVDQTAKIKVSSKRIAWAKFINCGQTCIAPD